MNQKTRNLLLFLPVFLISCSGLERSEKEKLRRQNVKAEYIVRADQEIAYPIAVPEHTPRAPYPWESDIHLPRITQDFFRCRGSPFNPPRPHLTAPLLDCDARHGLPILKGKETVYPILIDLLNYLQKKTGKRVIITCGHRCPAHNAYADPSFENQTSKHLIGAEVDFYVQGMEERPQEIAGLLMQYYQEHPAYKDQKEYLSFRRYDKPDSRISTPPWYNKEIFIKIYHKHEGRDGDNRHPHPYLSLQVRYDRESQTKVQYDWNKASLGYARSPGTHHESSPRPRYTERDSKVSLEPAPKPRG